MASFGAMAIHDEEEENDDISIADRLKDIKIKVQKATKEALQSGTNDATEQHPLQNKDPNASFHLGMELFGQEVSEIQRTVHRELTALEAELQDIMDTASREGAGRTFSQTEEEGSSSSPLSLADLERQGEELKIKILFLRECSSARCSLDESVTLSSPALAPGGEADYLQAAKLLVQAERSLAKADGIVQSTQKQQQQDQEQRQLDEKRPLSPALKTAFKILDSIRASVRRQRVELLGRAKAMWHSSVSCSEHSIEVRGGLDNGGGRSSSLSTPGLASAYDVLEAFEGDGHSALTEVLANFTNKLHRDVLQHVLRNHRVGSGAPKMDDWVFHEVEDRRSSSMLSSRLVSSKAKGTVRRLEWSCDEDVGMNEPKTEGPVQPGDQSNLIAWKVTIAFVQRIVSFVADHVLLQRPKLCNFVGQRLFGKPGALATVLNLDALGLESCRIGDDDHGLLMEPLLHSMSETCLPVHLESSQLGQLHSMAEELRGFVRPFLQELVAKNLLPAEGDSRLSVFVSKFENKYVDNRRCLLLNEARDLLMYNDYHNTVEVGVDIKKDKYERVGIDDGMGVFLLHKSCISVTAKKLMELCRRTMDEAVEQQHVPKDSPLALLPANLYRTAREVLDLFRAIIPVTHGREVHDVPRTAAVLHNDCVFFAHHCLTLGLEYKDKFSPAEHDDVRANLLRQTCLFVDMVPLFRELADRSMGDMLDLQAQQIVEIVGQRIPILGKALRSDEILAEWADAEVALTAGLYHLRHLSQSWHPVLAYEVLNRSICYLADVIFSLFLDQVTKAPVITANACQFVSTLFQKATDDIGELVSQDKSGSRVWDRFSAVGQFMDMNLADIQVALADGVFRSVTGPELTHLITATFDDTPKRQFVLQLLAAN